MENNNSSLPGHSLRTAGSFLFLAGIGGIVAPILGTPRILGQVGMGAVVLGILCWLVSDWKWARRSGGNHEED